MNLLVELKLLVVESIYQRLESHRAKVAKARDWIRLNLRRSTSVRRSVYGLKHVFERDTGSTHILAAVFAKALLAEGFRIDRHPHGDRVYAIIVTGARYK